MTIQVVDENLTPIVDSDSLGLTKMNRERLEEQLEDDVGLEDYEIDRINDNSKVLFSEPERVNKGIFHAKSLMSKIFIVFSVFIAFSLVGLLYVWKGYTYYLYFYIIVQLMIVYWILMISPLRHHGFESDNQYIKYRGYIKQGNFLKAHIRDDKYKFMLYFYWVLDAMVFCSIANGNRTLGYLNNVIYDRGKFPNSIVSSLIPVLIVIGFGVNIFGGWVYSRYKKLNVTQDSESEDPRIKKMIAILIALSFIALFIIGAINSKAFIAFWTPSQNSSNWLYVFSNKDPLFHARMTLILYYLVIFVGPAFLGFLILLGFSSAELGFLHVMIRKSRQEAEIPERIWEYKPVLKRQEKEKSDKNKARKRALLEIIIVNVVLVVGMWVGLYLGDARNLNIPGLVVMGYIVLGLGILWFIFFSPVLHAKKDGKYYYPTVKQNMQYAWFDERGLGSWKYYYRNVWGKKKRLLAWLTLWFIMCMSMYLLKWDNMWNNSESTGILINYLGKYADPNSIVVSVILLMTVISIVGFIASLGQTKENFRGSVFWNIFYKVVWGFMVAACFKWITTVPQITSQINILSLQFWGAFGLVAAVFAIIGIVANIIIFPILVKFDNFHAAKEWLLFIIVITIVLILLLVFIFQVFLPMTGVGGVVLHNNYPFRSGVQYETKNLWDKFWMGPFFAEWGGNYIWWGALQQFLFMSYFLVLWRKVFPNSKGYIIAIGTAMIFGVIHAIDWPLMLLAGISGLMWAYFWQREYYDKQTGKVHHGNNLLLWGFIHGFSGTLVGLLLPFTMAVGPFNM